MKVYIATSGELSEGYGIIGVFEKEEDARKCCEEEEKKKNFVGCDFTDVEEWDVE